MTKANFFDGILEIAKGNPWILPALGVCGIAGLGIHTYANHDAMEHGYNRTVKFGKLELGVYRNPELPS